MAVTHGKIRRAPLVATLVLGGSAAAQTQGGEVNVICSVQADWCNMIRTVYAKTTGTRVNCRSRARAKRWPS